jgi:hypothetical protein
VFKVQQRLAAVTAKYEAANQHMGEDAALRTLRSTLQALIVQSKGRLLTQLSSICLTEDGHVLPMAFWSDTQPLLEFQLVPPHAGDGNTLIETGEQAVTCQHAGH